MRNLGGLKKTTTKAMRKSYFFDAMERAFQEDTSEVEVLRKKNKEISPERKQELLSIIRDSVIRAAVIVKRLKKRDHNITNGPNNRNSINIANETSSSSTLETSGGTVDASGMTGNGKKSRIPERIRKLVAKQCTSENVSEYQDVLLAELLQLARLSHQDDFKDRASKFSKYTTIEQSPTFKLLCENIELIELGKRAVAQNRLVELFSLDLMNRYMKNSAHRKVFCLTHSIESTISRQGRSDTWLSTLTSTVVNENMQNVR